ncbi:MAG TPA: Glu/Leu/Phe/Val dehydrogenase dimerization domain-containing protein [Thermoanaerobaculia bacterium]|jgi:glutamate dehydrogenase/leucine dehydrogenase
MKTWDGESLVSRRDAETNAWMFVALHSSRLGPSTGGTRMIPYDDLASARRDAMRLSEGMTYKWAAAGFPRGGGKGVIAAPPGLDVRARAGLLRRYGQLVKDLGGRFWTGADAGTSAADMDVIAETGTPYVFSRTEGNGGAGGSGPWTALGLFASLEAVCGRLFGAASLAGRRVLVQGAGSVGRPLIERLAAAGARVSFSDIEPDASRLPSGIAATYVSPESLFDTDCDVFAPCALGAVLNAGTIPRLRCRAVVGAANNQLAELEDAERLRAAGLLYAPDFVVNAGGAIAITGIEALGWSREKAEREVEGIAGTLSGILDLADSEGITTEAAARRVAERHIAGARTGSAK